MVTSSQGSEVHKISLRCAHLAVDKSSQRELHLM